MTYSTNDLSELNFQLKFFQCFLQEIIAQTTFVLTNAEPLLDFPRPISQKVIQIAGLSEPEVKPLEKV